MLSKETEMKLVQLFITLSTGEEKISKLKQDILNEFYINPIQIFFKLDIDNLGFINKRDICLYLKSFSINYYSVNVDFLFYFFDKDNDGVLNFNELVDLIISDSNYLYKKSYRKKFRTNKIEPKELSCEIDIDIEKSILKIFLEEIKLSNKLCEIIHDIKQCQDFSLQDIFYEIKSYSYITHESLKAFFDRNDVSYNDIFIKNIFNRFDNKEINGKISFNKFKLFFEIPFITNPKSKKNPNNFGVNNYSPLNNNLNSSTNGYNTNNLSTSNINQVINQTQISGDIKIYNNNSIMKSNINNAKQPNYNMNYNTNNNYINEEDIQFECSHMSRKSSVDSNTNKNCGSLAYLKNSNALYRNYLREKRSKSLEKSLSRSLSRSSDFSYRQNNQNIPEEYINNGSEMNLKTKNNYHQDYEENNNLRRINSGEFNDSNSVSSGEDIRTQLPIRLDKKLVKRKLPARNHNCHTPQHMAQRSPPHHHYYFNEESIIPQKHEMTNYRGDQYFSGYLNNERIIPNNLDAKIYKEDVKE